MSDLAALLDRAEAIVDERLAALGVTLKYSPTQPRNEEGEWTSGGGGHASMDEVLGDAALDIRIYSDLNKSPNKKAIGAAVAKHLKSTSGAVVSDAEGFEMARAVHQYAGNIDNYEKVRSGKDPKTAKQLDSLISKSAPFEGEIYRGMSFNDEAFASGLKKGAAVDMKGVSSWSSDKKHSTGFASTKKVGVLMSVQNKSAASITFLSKDEREQELLSPSSAKYKVKSVTKTQKGGRTIYNVKLEEE